MKYPVKALLALVFILFVGCGTPPSDFSAGSVYGKVVDVTTRAGISGAKVYLYVSGDEKSATTSSDKEDTTYYNEAGDFKIAGVEDGTHRLIVSIDGYATYEQWVNFANPSNSAASYSVLAGVTGTISMQRGCSVNVYVVEEDSGSPISGVTVYATSAGVTAPEISVVSDTEGLAAFTGLAQLTTYTLTGAPFDSDSDGTYDFSTGNVAGYNCTNSDSTVALEMNIARRDDTIQVIAGSFDAYPTLGNRYGTNDVVAASSFGVVPAGPITLVFNYPVEMTDGSSVFNLTNNYLLSTNASYGTGVGVTASNLLSAGNTILTITPSSALATNGMYNLVGSVSAVISGERQYSSFDSLATDYSNWYAFYASEWTLEGSVTADNYNGSNDASLAAAQVFLEFPEYLYGTAEVISYNVAGVERYPTVASNEVDLSGGMIVIDEGTANARNNTDANNGAGCTAGAVPCGCPTHDSTVTACNAGTTPAGEVKYAVGIPVTTLPAMADWLEAAVQTVTVFIDATDYEGNQYTGSVTLPIQ